MDTSMDLLSRFADAADPGTRRGALIDLIKTKQLHGVASDEAFQRGLERLARSAQDAGQDTDRLLGVAALLHAAATAPSIRASVESLVRSAVSGPLSKLHELPGVHERLYAARSWRVVPAAWSLDALAIAAAREESGEAVRKECIEAIVGLATKIEKAVSALREALLAVTFETKKPGDSLARRLNRVFSALTDSLSRSHKPVGSDIGREISSLVERGFRGAGRPESPAVRLDVVEHVAVLTHAIVRADFSLAGHDKRLSSNRYGWIEVDGGDSG